MSKKVFEDIKVAEFAWVGVGPQSSRYLADHGATVVKIESHSRPDLLRVAVPFAENKPGLNRSMFFGKYNANKYGVSLDLNHPGGRELAIKFIQWADIVTESFRPGTMQKWGLDYESMKKIKPDIIYLSTSLQGQSGPFSRYAGPGDLLMALGGFGELSGWSDRDPSPPYGAYSDYLCQRFNATALIAALDYRRRTGKGQWIEQSQLETSIHFLAPLIMDYTINGKIAQRNGNRHDLAAPHGVYACKGDDRWLAVTIFDQEEWRALCGVMDRPDLECDPKFATLDKRKENEDELDGIIGSWTSRLTAEEAETQLQASGVCAHRVARNSDLFNDPQLKHRRFYVPLKHPEMGEPSYCQQAHYILSKTPRDINKPSPCTGGHNDYVYKELLGMTDAEIQSHIADGSITS